tara:strand:+ start:152 stop:373 length:222 start_codon:yes stop_codon:yes gene_type:complete
MNIITIFSPNKTVVVKRIGTIKESIGYIGGYLQALHENDINLNTISVDHKYINSNGTETNHSDWVDTNTKLIN